MATYHTHWALATMMTRRSQNIFVAFSFYVTRAITSKIPVKRFPVPYALMLYNPKSGGSVSTTGFSP